MATENAFDIDTRSKGKETKGRGIRTNYLDFKRS
ncbi:hypothetical protein FOXG_21616 [Fusarium oxysporum f. sp. lycopersici 4287]|uniref:Uncharacterized protein n=2 Tax=Fusarium oxysporum TaxID=5507 RepID=A0A0J9WTM3_FUSO4|nr:hypothetical protein FOXG_21616 [Fusarium oxysporum f. sp. lycopersici 4287]EXK35774.1 hypothetical protein FOMG_08977 [Fusarium oxysporum f. sp. melonis 26406]KNB16282.1 hypothetical protein FOXG_21616 [Fusarium oxysporum f. sp. lycopersici 4287]